MSPKISDLELACRFADGGMLGERRGKEEVIKVGWLPTKKLQATGTKCNSYGYVFCHSLFRDCFFQNSYNLKELLNCQIYCHHVAF